MGEAAVESFLENLKQLQLHQSDLIKDVRSSIEKLENELRLLIAFLKATTKRWRNDDRFQQLLHQVCEMVYRAEAVIDAFLTKAATTRSSKRRLLGRLYKSIPFLPRVTDDVEKVIDQFKMINNETQLFEFDSTHSARDEYKVAPKIREENIVGFEDEAEILTWYVKEESEELDVIAIVGMSGAGKTTLAWKIYRDPQILLEFPILIWVDVGEELRMRDVLLTILRKFTSDDAVYSKSEPELAQLVTSYLEREKFLIVMDGVWTIDDWNKLQLALPKGNRKGKVLMTSCKEDVARIANRTRDPYRLHFLSHEESWMMLQLEVFGKLDECPDELEPLGMLIAEQCGGLPVAIVVTGKLIVNMSRLKDIGTQRQAWTQVYKTMHIHLDLRSYNELPNHLRVCFLYIGMFPEDYEIPAWRLIRMWIAEGFIVAKDGMSYEETAHDYLEDLVNRNLVMVEKSKANGGVKTCRIPGTLHEFCKSEGGIERENVFHEIKQSCNAGSESISSQVLRNRRICIHSNVLDFLSSIPDSPNVRSLVSFSENEVTLPIEISADIPSAFELLRVLDVQPIRITKIHKIMFRLFNLRYLVMSFNMKELPPAFDKLWNLQTLVVHTTCPTLEIQADIWQLIQLRHLKTNVSATLPRIGKSSKGGEQLQTLGTISPECCTKEFLERGRNLKKLGIRGQLSLLLPGSTDFFDGFGRLSNLQKLKLVNEVVMDQGKLHQLHLPPPNKFPPNLRSLTLDHTYLDWTEMSILGKIFPLEMLKLNHNAFMGEKWEATDGDFRSLQLLHIEDTDLVVWEASYHHFPKLRRLNLRNCDKLQQIPIGLADIPSLQHLDLYNTQLAAASAQKIHEAKKIPKDEGIQLGVFKLSISSPPE